MGDIGELWNDIRKKQQQTKSDRLKNNTEILLIRQAEFEFELTTHSEYHYSLYQPGTNNRFDYWPSTGKGGWFDKKTNTMYGKPFFIQDIEAFILKHFKPE
jgi:hypothetical protein